MGLLDTILSAIDNKKRTLKRGVMDMLDNPGDWSNMTAARMDENMYGGPENWDAMKKYYSRQPYDKNLREKALQAMTNNAINESLGGIFIGKGAKTWDAMKEADALARLAKGEDAATVWKETGVGVAPWDKMARGEISDHIAPTKMDATVENLFKYPKVGEYMSHKPLYESYPDTQAITLANGRIGQGGGAWLKDQNVIELGAPYFNNKSLDTNRSNKSTAIHELQHAIQSKEGFAKGGNTSSFEDLNKSIKNTQTRQESQLEALARADQNGGIDPVSGFDRERIRENLKLIGNQRAEFMAKEGAGLDPYDAYRSLAGEAESRLTQYRMNLTPEARSALYPYDPTYFKQATGVDIDKLITRGLLDDGPAMSVAPKLTEFEQRHLTAQKNAALPVEQGGLGLPPNNTAMDRARAMGFDTPAYHGSGRDFTEFNNSMLGAKTGAKSAQKAHFFASNPEVSNTYVNTSHVYNDSPPIYEKLFNNPEAFDAFTKAETKDAKWAVLENNGMNYSSGQVMPVLLNQGKTRVKDYGGSGYRDSTYNDELIAAKKSKKDSVELKNTFDRGPHEGYNSMTNVYAVFDPSNIRSRFAAFDPKRRHEADLLGYADPYLLGSMGAGGLLGMGGYSMMNDK
jgi:hypothetical protein